MLNKWAVLALLFCAGALNYADRTAISALFPLLRRDLEINDIGLAAVGSLFLWSYAATSPVAGLIADRVSRSRLVAGSLAAWSLVTAATGAVTDANQLYALRLLLGVAECLYLPAALGLIADYHGTGTRATALSMHAASLSIGMVAGGTAAGYLGEHFGWRPAFFVLGGAGLAVSLLAAFWLRDAANVEAPVREPVAATLRALSRIPAIRIILTEAALIAITSWTFANWLPLYFRETYGLTLAAAGFAGTFALTAGTTTGGLVGGYFSDRFTRGRRARRVLLMGTFYSAAAPLLLVFLLQPPLAVLGAAIFLHGLVRSCGGTNEVPFLCDLLPAHRRSTAFGFLNAMNTFIGGSGVLVSGFLKSHFGLGGVFAGLSAVVFLAAMVCLAGYRWVVPRDLGRDTAHS